MFISQNHNGSQTLIKTTVIVHPPLKQATGSMQYCSSSLKVKSGISKCWLKRPLDFQVRGLA